MTRRYHGVPPTRAPMMRSWMVEKTTISTLDTAIAAVSLADALESTTDPKVDKAAVNRQILRARRFCYQMLYRNREAYWTAKPSKRIGGVRTSPSGAAVSLQAVALIALVGTSII